MSAVKRVGGLLLVIIAIVSLLLTLAGLVGVWALYQPITASLATGLDLAADTLRITGEALVLIDDGLLNASLSAAAAQAATRSLSESLAVTKPALNSAADLLSKGLPGAIGATDMAIHAAQGTAETVDNVLTALAGLPLLGINYSPDTPLAGTLAEISDSLADVPANLETIGQQLTVSAENLPTIVDSVGGLAAAIGGLTATIDNARQTAQAYQALIARYQDAVVFLQRALPVLTALAPLLLSLFLFWLGVVQVNALLRGLEWMGVRRRPAHDSITMESITAQAVSLETTAEQLSQPLA